MSTSNGATNSDTIPAEKSDVGEQFLSDLRRLTELQQLIGQENGQIGARYDELEAVLEVKLKDIRHRRGRVKEHSREARALHAKLAAFTELLAE